MSCFHRLAGPITDDDVATHFCSSCAAGCTGQCANPHACGVSMHRVKNNDLQLHPDARKAHTAVATTLYKFSFRRAYVQRCDDDPAFAADPDAAKFDEWIRKARSRFVKKLVGSDEAAVRLAEKVGMWPPNEEYRFCYVRGALPGGFEAVSTPSKFPPLPHVVVRPTETVSVATADALARCCDGGWVPCRLTGSAIAAPDLRDDEWGAPPTSTSLHLFNALAALVDAHDATRGDPEYPGFLARVFDAAAFASLIKRDGWPVDRPFPRRLQELLADAIAFGALDPLTPSYGYIRRGCAAVLNERGGDSEDAGSDDDSSSSETQSLGLDGPQIEGTRVGIVAMPGKAGADEEYPESAATPAQNAQRRVVRCKELHFLAAGGIDAARAFEILSRALPAAAGKPGSRDAATAFVGTVGEMIASESWSNLPNAQVVASSVVAEIDAGTASAAREACASLRDPHVGALVATYAHALLVSNDCAVEGFDGAVRIAEAAVASAPVVAPAARPKYVPPDLSAPSFFTAFMAPRNALRAGRAPRLLHILQVACERFDGDRHSLHLWLISPTVGMHLDEAFARAGHSVPEDDGRKFAKHVESHAGTLASAGLRVESGSVFADTTHVDVLLLVAWDEAASRTAARHLSTIMVNLDISRGRPARRTVQLPPLPNP